MMTDPARVIRPTHSCFDDAIDLIAHRVTVDPALARGTTLRLVHGIALAPADVVDGLRAGDRFAHAWVEEDVPGQLEAHVWQMGILNGERVAFAMTRSEFQRRLQIQASTSYTCRQVYHENRRSGTYGPWREEYRALCRRQKERR